jgi:hypothetical protein
MDFFVVRKTETGQRGNERALLTLYFVKMIGASGSQASGRASFHDFSIDVSYYPLTPS